MDGFAGILFKMQALDAARALAGGAVLGLISYATYNLTNLATLRAWSRKVTIADMAWGVFATAIACWIVAHFVVAGARPDGA